MPTSATGAERPGFTLVELLIVLTIMSLAAAAVVLALPESRPTLTQEAERLAARMHRAQEAAIVENRMYAVQIDARGYAFALRREGQWLELTRPPFAQAAWEDGTRPELNDGRPLRLAFDPAGVAEPAEIVLRRDGERRRVRVDGAGDVTVATDDPV